MTQDSVLTRPHATTRPLRVGLVRCLVLCLGALVLAGCTSTRHRAPVEARGEVGTISAPVLPPVSAPKAGSTPPPMVAEPAARPSTYTVKPGDTLIRIGLDAGQNWRDIARWSGLDNPNLIEVGQVLRILPPGGEASVAARPVTPPARADMKPADAPAAGTVASAGQAAAPAAVTPAAPTAPNSPTVAVARDADEDISWLWPAAGQVLTPFDDSRSKGLAIGGKAGDAVLAAADGRVVYAGSGLRGYGNLVIVKHNGTFLSAYAHNQTLLVKEDQNVRRGQKIAEMGSSDAERVQLHFEIRRQGKPVDPARYLPQR